MISLNESRGAQCDARPSLKTQDQALSAPASGPKDGSEFRVFEFGSVLEQVGLVKSM